MKCNRYLIFLVCPITAMGGGVEQSALGNGDWEFSLSAGAGWRQSGSLKFSGASRAAGADIPSWVGGSSLVVPPIGSESGVDVRYYDDGFVGTDSSTSIDGLTSNWSYLNAGQVDVANDRITFHATGFGSVLSNNRALGAPASSTHEERGIAPVLRFNARQRREAHGVRYGFDALLAWNPVRYDNRWSDVAVDQRREDFRHDWSDVFNLGGFGAFIPPAPYTGMADAPGFLLPNIPDSRSMVAVPVGMADARITNHVTSRFRADHTTLSFGPTVSVSIAPQWNLEAGMGVSLNWIRWSSSQQESLTATVDGAEAVVGQWNDSASGNRILAGIYLQLAVEWVPEEPTWSVQGLFRIESSQSMEGPMGPGRYRYSTDGMMAAVLWTRAF